MAKARQRIPKLRLATWGKLGWHVSFRDRGTGTPREHLFNIREREREPEARVLYHASVREHLGGNSNTSYPTKAKPATRRRSATNVLSGSLLE